MADHHSCAVGVQLKFGDLFLGINVPYAHHWVDPRTDQIPIVNHFNLVNKRILVYVDFDYPIELSVIQDKEADRKRNYYPFFVRQKLHCEYLAARSMQKEIDSWIFAQGMM